MVHEVGGFDHSPRMVQLARERVAQADFRVHDAAEPLGWLAGGSYFDTRVVEETWSRGWQLRYWLAPLEQTCEELHRAGFLIERLLEPRPSPDAQGLRPEDYERLHREPSGFLAIRALARP